MELSNLKPANGSVRNKKRVGRGPGSGNGRTAGRGNNGYRSRSGSGSKIHYEGGQTPLMRRLPKRGFSNYPFKQEVQIVNIESIARLELEKIDVNTLIKNGLVKKAHLPVKILGNGDIVKSVEIHADSFSASAIKKIEKAGGKAIYLWLTNF